MSLSEEQLVQNYEKYTNILLQTGEDRTQNIQAMIDHFGDRLILCPASSKKSYHNSFPGGLVDHSLRVFKNCTRLMKVTPDIYEGISDQSVAFASLFHDIGKLGSLEQERYLVQTNDYYAKRGNLYEINQKMPYSMTSHTSIFLLQNFGIKMTFDEFQAILIADGMYVDVNKSYGMNEMPLSLLVHQADRISCEQEKQMENNS